MLFDHSANLPFQLLGWVMVFVGLIVLNEFARRSKVGGSSCLVCCPWQ